MYFQFAILLYKRNSFSKRVKLWIEITGRDGNQSIYDIPVWRTVIIIWVIHCQSLNSRVTNLSTSIPTYCMALVLFYCVLCEYILYCYILTIRKAHFTSTKTLKTFIELFLFIFSFPNSWSTFRSMRNYGITLNCVLISTLNQLYLPYHSLIIHK